MLALSVGAYKTGKTLQKAFADQRWNSWRAEPE